MLISGLVVILKPFVSVSVIPLHPDFAGFSNTSCRGGAFVGVTLDSHDLRNWKGIASLILCGVLCWDMIIAWICLYIYICIHTLEKVAWYVYYVYMCIHIYTYIHIYIYICTYVCTYIHVAYAPHWLVICQLWFHHLSNCKVSGRASRTLGGAGGSQLFI